jgi:hypothetical protein
MRSRICSAVMGASASKRAAIRLMSLSIRRIHPG